MVRTSPHVLIRSGGPVNYSILTLQTIEKYLEFLFLLQKICLTNEHLLAKYIVKVA